MNCSKNRNHEIFLIINVQSYMSIKNISEINLRERLSPFLRSVRSIVIVSLFSFTLGSYFVQQGMRALISGMLFVLGWASSLRWNGVENRT